MHYIDGYESVSLKKEIEVTDIFSIHYFEYTKDFFFKGEKHNFWEMCYVDNGVVEITADSMKHVLFKGDAIFHKPGEFHSLKANGKTAPNLVVFSFLCNSPAVKWFENKIVKICDRDRKLMGRILFEAKQSFSTPLSDPMIKRIERKPSASFGSEQIIKMYIEEFLLNFIRDDLDVIRQEKPQEYYLQGTVEAVYSRVVNFMMENITGNISTEDICRFAGFSRSYLHRIFKNRSGRSLMEYYKRLKLEKAKQLIREGEYNFSEISYKLNFSSLQNFSKLFKQYFGMTPRDYAKSVKLNSEFVIYPEKSQSAEYPDTY